MSAFDFSTLNSTDLEELVCDLLNADQPAGSPIKYKTFKEGKDKGIDLLYSSEEKEFDHVGQVKHFRNTGYTGLISELKKETIKVNKLKPNRYIVATSVDLGVSNVEEIKVLFIPYIKNLHDIYGKKDLNRLIDLYDFVLNNHYKLWFSSTSVLKKILNSDLEFRSSILTEDELKRKLRIYVKTPIFDKARKLLKANKFILITGDPGIGKTSLAEMLIYEYIKEDYHLTYIIDNIKDAERVLVPDGSKQIIYYDDFLGSTAVEINKAKGSDTSLRKTLSVIKRLENKVLILTTRTFLLKSAIEESENLKRFNIRVHESIIDLNEYSNQIKKEILNNHIEDSEIKEKLKSLLYNREIQQFIISHSNFSPRSIEFLTSKENVNQYSVKEFQDFIFKCFNSPDIIWEHAYSKQITEDDRLLLNTLLSFDETPTKEQLEIAFQKRLYLEAKTNNKKNEINAFMNSLNRLDSGFILIRKEKISFINNSLIDFLYNYLSNDINETRKILESICFSFQFNKKIFLLNRSKNVTIPDILKERLLNDYYSFVNEKSRNRDLIQLTLIIYENIKSKEAVDVVCEIIEENDVWESLYDDYSINVDFRAFLSSVRENPRINALIEKKLNEFLMELVTGENEISESITILEDFITSYKLDIKSFDINRLESYIDQLISDYIEQEIEWLSDSIYDEQEVYDKKYEIQGLINRAIKIGLQINQDLKEFDNNDWLEIIMDNEYRRFMEKDD